MKEFKEFIDSCFLVLFPVFLMFSLGLLLYTLGNATKEKDSCLKNYFEGVTDRDYSFEDGCKLKYKGEWITLKEYNDNYGFWSRR